MLVSLVKSIAWLTFLDHSCRSLSASFKNSNQTETAGVRGKIQVLFKRREFSRKIKKIDPPFLLAYRLFSPKKCKKVQNPSFLVKRFRLTKFFRPKKQELGFALKNSGKTRKIQRSFLIWGGSITPKQCFRKREFKEFPLKTFQNHKKFLTFAKNGNILYFLNEMGTLCLSTKVAKKKHCFGVQILRILQILPI